MHFSPNRRYPEEGGFWSLTRAADVHAATRDFEPFGSELRIWIEQTLDRFPDLALDGTPTRFRGLFLNQHTSIPVRTTG